MRKNSEFTEIIRARTTKEIKEDLKIFAATRGLTVSHIIREMVDYTLEVFNNKPFTLKDFENGKFH